MNFSSEQGKKGPGVWLYFLIPIFCALAVYLVIFFQIAMYWLLIIIIFLISFIYFLIRRRRNGAKRTKVISKLTKKLMDEKERSWYLTIGFAESGKTSLFNSLKLYKDTVDLVFWPGEDNEEQNESLKECNVICDLKDNKIAIIDAPGRYITHDDDDPTRKEWQKLLEDITKIHKTVDGLIIAVDVISLLRDEQAIKRDANAIFGRIKDIVTAQEAKFPVYLIFTKCDQIYGFSQFFSKDEALQSQVWGCTLKLDQQKDLKKAFIDECELLYQNLNKYRLLKISSQNVDKKEDLYVFPLQFEYVYKKLAEFVSYLFPRTEEEKNPIFRGFYFTSCMQNSPSSDFVIKEFAKTIGQQNLIASSQNNDESKDYFIKDLFNKVIFADRKLVKPSSIAQKEKNRTRLAICGGIILLALIAFLLSYWSYSVNKKLIDNAQIAIYSLDQFYGNDQQIGREQLETIRKYIIKLEGTNFGSIFCSSQQKAVADELRKLYLKRRYGSDIGSESKLKRQVKISVSVSIISETGDTTYLPKKKVTALIVNANKKKQKKTNKNGACEFKINVDDGKIYVVFSIDYTEPEYKSLPAQIYEIQPGNENQEDVSFAFIKSERTITITCTDQKGEPLQGVPVSASCKASKSKNSSDDTSNASGEATLKLDAPDNSDVLISYGDSAKNYKAEANTLKINPGQMEYNVERIINRKYQISVTVSSVPPSGIAISIGGKSLGRIFSDGKLASETDVIPTRQNIYTDPPTSIVSFSEQGSEYKIDLSY